MSQISFNPVSLQILWDRLIGIVDEAALALYRTSFSPVVQECNDYTAVIMDSRGRSIADNPRCIPAFIGTMPHTIRQMLKVYPAGTWAPGDVVLTNDPWIGTGHLPDFSLVSPVFHRERLVGFMGSVAHAIDIGGVYWSSYAREVFEEGIRIPISRLIRNDVTNGDIVGILRANVRLPDQVIGDIFAQVASLRTGEARLLEFMADTGLDELDTLADAVQDQSERSMRDAIRRIPEGHYQHQFDIDGFDERLRICCEVSVREGSLAVDFAGTSAQVPHGINSPINYTYAYTCYPLKCALDPSMPKNEGSYRPFTISAPEGTLLNPRSPAPVAGRHLTGMFCAAGVFGCLAKAIPEAVIAESSGPPARPVLTGTGDDGRPFTLIVFAWGGMGARATMDGMPCMAFPGNDSCASVEIMESAAPVTFERKQLIPDSGGPGRHQGGGGQEIVIRYNGKTPAILSMMSQRFGIPPAGLLGGASGSLSEFLINGEAKPQNARYIIGKGDVVTVRYPGGGGYGYPAERSRELVLRDIADGVISAERGRDIYGVP
jgi:N-methylhydantoinase B